MRAILTLGTIDPFIVWFLSLIYYIDYALYKLRLVYHLDMFSLVRGIVIVIVVDCVSLGRLHMTSCQQGLHLAAPLTSIIVAISSLSAQTRADST